MILEGLDLEVGSVREQLALTAYRDNQYTKYVQTLLIVKAIMVASDRISAALTDGQSSSGNDLKELLQTYKELLMPECVEERAKQAEKVQKIMKRESEIGAFKVEPMVFGQRKKKGLN